MTLLDGTGPFPYPLVIAVGRDRVERRRRAELAGNEEVVGQDRLRSRAGRPAP